MAWIAKKNFFNGTRVVREGTILQEVDEVFEPFVEELEEVAQREAVAEPELEPEHVRLENERRERVEARKKKIRKP